MLTGSFCTYTHEVQKMPLQVALHINKILDMVNEDRQDNLFSVYSVRIAIQALKKKYNTTGEQAAVILRKLVQGHYTAGTLKKKLEGGKL